MILNEILKPFLSEPERYEYSSEPQTDKNLQIIDDEPVYGNSFFDNDIFGMGQSSNSSHQTVKIDQYRKIAQRPEVHEGLQEIINEIIFTQSGENPLKVHSEIDNEKLQEQIQNCFTKISVLMRLDLKLFDIVKQAYVDGQMVFHLAYSSDSREIKKGIQKITMMDPRGLYLDPKDNCYKYEGNSNTKFDKKVTYSQEEIVRVDFGLHDGDVTLSYLEQVIKVSNMLQALEDMLIPLRFSRSISRRVFNVDIGDLPPKRGQQVMNEYQRRFKYKKFYNTETGEISNNQHITSMVEDYWFQNRSGGKGTTVDVLDESGNLGEISDILYFNKKLYKAMGIPQSRQNSLSSDYNQVLDLGSNSFSQEDVQFYLFISRLRKVYSEMFKEILRREVIATGVMTLKEYNQNSQDIRVVFTSELMFLDKIKMHLFNEKINAFRDQMEYQGKIFSQKTQIKNIFNLTEEEIIQEMEEIKKEEKDPLFSHLYDQGGF